MELNIRDQLLDAALDMFYLTGYESTTINAIIEKVGVSKGAFYHYFASKEAVLGTLCQRYIARQLATIEKVAADQSLQATDKLIKIMLELSNERTRDSAGYAKIYALLQRNSNAETVRQVLKDSNLRGQALYLQIITQGINEGSFATNYPTELAELYVYLINVMKRSLQETAPGSLNNKLRFYEEALCRLLGAEEGSLRLADTLLRQLQGV